MHTALRLKFDSYSEYGCVDGGAWFIRRSVDYSAICWC
jgi:hypothetical protein